MDIIITIKKASLRMAIVEISPSCLSFLCPCLYPMLNHAGSNWIAHFKDQKEM